MATFNSHTETDNVTGKAFFLENSELMAMTCSHLQVENVEKHRCLLSAALTCKDFLEVALNALWEELDSLVPLLKLLPSLKQIGGRDKYYVLGDVSQADWDRLRYYSRRVKIYTNTNSDHKVHPSTSIRIAQLQSSALFPSLRHLHFDLADESTNIMIFLFLSPLLDSLTLLNFMDFEDTIVGPFLATLSSQSQICQIVLHNGFLSTDILKSIVHFKQLRSLELSDMAILDNIWEVLGTLPSLANLILDIEEAPIESNSQSGCSKHFVALETLCVTDYTDYTFQHLLHLIDSPCLKSINLKLKPYSEPQAEDPFASSMMIVASKWSQSLKNLAIASSTSDHYASSKSLMLLMDLHEMQTFDLNGWTMENMDDDVRRLVMSWPKLRTLTVLPRDRTFISLSTLRIIAEHCPELRHLHIQLDTSTIPPFDTSSESLHHNLEILNVEGHNVDPSNAITQTTLQSQIQVTRYLDRIFPYLKGVVTRPDDLFWLGIRDLVELSQDARRVK